MVNAEAALNWQSTYTASQCCGQTCELRSVLLFDGSPWQQSSLGAWGRSSSIGQRSHESGRAGHVHDSSEVQV